MNRKTRRSGSTVLEAVSRLHQALKSKMSRSQIQQRQEIFGDAYDHHHFIMEFARQFQKTENDKAVKTQNSSRETRSRMAGLNPS
jgi:hypothetical protein